MGDKILIVGPAKAGKTAIANFLAKYPDAERAASPASTYTPTVGTRILEFDASTHSAQSWKGGRESIELWDCSGDKKFEKCFPAIMKGAVGAILVYNPDDQEHLAQLQYWHDKMIRPMKLNDEQVIVFQHRPQATFLPPKERKERLLRAYDQGPTSLNVNANIVRQRFEDFADIISQVSTRQGDDAMADLG